MRTLIATVLLTAVLTSQAVAQGQQPPYQPPPPPPPIQPQQQPYPQQPQPYPQPYQQQPYGYQQQPQYQLTVDEQWLLERGYISDGEHIGGGLGALFIGFGIGQAIQGRWSEKGWIFTFGEAGSFGLMMWGLTRAFDNCYESAGPCGDDGFGMFIGGMLAFSVFRIWETVDAFAAPGSHNQRVRSLHMRMGMPVPMYTRVIPYVAPPRDGDGAIGGVSLRF